MSLTFDYHAIAPIETHLCKVVSSQIGGKQRRGDEPELHY